MSSILRLASVILVLVVGGLVTTSPSADAQANDKDLGFADLIAAVKATPGCLGVETAQTGSGKMVIFAWFEDKRATLKWYYSDAHQEVMKKFFPGAKRPTKPLADVPDDSGPIMAVASITLAGKPTKENPLPFKQSPSSCTNPSAAGCRSAAASLRTR